MLKNVFFVLSGLLCCVASADMNLDNLFDDNKSEGQNESIGKNSKKLKIVIKGNKRIEIPTILEKLRIDKYVNSADIDEFYTNAMIKTLYSTGFFESINISKTKDSIIIDVKENPIVNKFAFEGNSKISDDDFKKLFKDELRPRTIFSLTNIKHLVKNIGDVYKSKGYYAVSITPKIVRLKDNVVNVIFEIKEGKITTVKKIMFIGNKSFSDYQLKGELLTKESAWWRFWSYDDIFVPQRIDVDKDLLTKFYKSKGFAAFEIESSFAEISDDKKAFYITFKINEGKVYKINNINIKSSIKDVPINELKKCITFKKNDIFNISLIEKAKYDMISLLGNKGYVFADVIFSIKNNSGNLMSDIVFEIKQGAKAYINQIKINGNIITKDQVIRREMLLHEQDAIQTDKLAKSIQNIRDLDFFSDVTVDKEPVSDNKANININVTEKSTAMLQLNLGVAIGRGVFSKIGISEKNFCGEGKYVSGEIMVGKYDKEIAGHYTIPHFMNRDLTLGTHASINKTDRANTNSYKSKGFSFGSYVDYDLTSVISHRLGYNFAYDDTTPDDEDSKNILLVDENGKKTRSKIYSYLTFQNTDSFISPRSGYVLSIHNAYCGLGGNVRYSTHSCIGKYYIPMFEKSVLLFKAEAGIMGTGAYIMDKFSLGGDNLRGFDYEGTGPRGRNSKTPNDGTALRGTRYYSGMIAYGVPLTEGIGQVRAVGFVQTGALWKSNKPAKWIYEDKKPRVSVGGGIEWYSPIGPLAITYAKAIKKQSYDQTQSFQIGALIID